MDSRPLNPKQGHSHISPFLVSPDTFIKQSPHKESGKTDLWKDTRKAETGQPVLIVEPPPPNIERNDLQSVEGPPDQELRRRSRRKVTSPNPKSQTLDIELKDNESNIMDDLEALRQAKNLTKKEMIVMTEILNSRKSRSRSSSRMERDVSPKDANKNESVVKKTDANESAELNRTEENRSLEIAASLKQANSEISVKNNVQTGNSNNERNLLGQENKSGNASKMKKVNNQQETRREEVVDIKKNKTQDKHKRIEKHEIQEENRFQMEDRQEKNKNETLMLKQIGMETVKRHCKQEEQGKQNDKDSEERQKKNRPKIIGQQEKQKGLEEIQDKSESQTEHCHVQKHEETYKYDPFEHVDNIADLTVENLKDHLFKDQDNGNSMNSAFGKFQQTAPQEQKCSTEVKTENIEIDKSKTEVKIEIQENKDIFHTKNTRSHIENLSTKNECVKNKENEASNLHHKVEKNYAHAEHRKQGSMYFLSFYIFKNSFF